MPNDEMTAFGFDTARMANLCISGNSVCKKLFNKSGELVGLYPYAHDITKISRNPDTKKLEYKIGNSIESETLSRAEVLHIPNMSFDGVIGLSPISYAAETIRLGLSYEKYGVNFYKNAAMPSGVFESPNVVGDTAYERLKKELKENYTGLKNSGVPMLLEEGMKWNQVTVNPIDAQLLESKYFQIEDIARVYRVPQHLINKLDRSTNNNIEHQSLEFVMYTMLPYFKRDEGGANNQVLTKKQRMDGYYFERKIDGLLRGDAKSRAEAYAVGRQWGWLSVNDIRKLENLSPIPNGDRYLEPTNMIEAGSSPEKAASNYARLVDEIYNMIEERR
jgi:HK97 family phage portal protein